MSTTESDFKASFKKSLIVSNPTALIWTNSDMFRAGLPDLSVSLASNFYAIECKFIKKLPKRETSKCLDHEVTENQVQFLKRNQSNGNHSAVVIGLQDVAVWTTEIKPNYTLKEIMSFPRIERISGMWNTNPLLNRIKQVARER